MKHIALLKGIITDQQEDLHTQLVRGNLIDRDLATNEIREIFLKGPGLVVVRGVRRCGKSTYAFSCFKDKFVYINFDDERLLACKAEDLNNLLLACYELYGSDLECFVFDEIQNVAGWELFISRIQKTNKIIITGSNANLLSKELATHLTGRYYPITLYPFSFREFIKFNELDNSNDFSSLSTKAIAEIKGLLSRYILEGGFPDVRKYGRLFSQNIYSDIINKDILQRYNLKAPGSFRKLALYIISNHAQEINLNSISRYVEIKDPHTTARYLSYLEETYLAFSLSRYFHRLKAQLVTNKKTYSIDSGVINTTAFAPTPSLASLYENIVFLELLRQRDYWQLFDEIFFWMGSDCEVDFIIRKQDKLLAAIQVSLDISGEKTLEREKKALLKINRDLKPKKFFIINDSVEDTLEESGITILLIPLWKWLLNPQKYFD